MRKIILMMVLVLACGSASAVESIKLESGPTVTTVCLSGFLFVVNYDKGFRGSGTVVQVYRPGELYRLNNNSYSRYDKYRPQPVTCK